MEIQQALHAWMLVTLSVGIIGMLTPNGALSSSLKTLCGLVLTLALLSPIKPILSTIGESLNVAPDHEGESEPTFDSAVQLKTKSLEKAIEQFLEETYRTPDASVALTVDVSQSTSIVITDAVITFAAPLSNMEQAVIRSDLSVMLECEVILFAPS